MDKTDYPQKPTKKRQKQGPQKQPNIGDEEQELNKYFLIVNSFFALK